MDKENKTQKSDCQLVIKSLVETMAKYRVSFEYIKNELEEMSGMSEDSIKAILGQLCDYIEEILEG